MKKTLAILLSCVLVVVALAAMAIFTSADATVAPSVNVNVGGTTTTLDATTTTVAATTGTVEFDAATGTLTITNTTGIQQIIGTNVGTVLTVKVVGNNTLGAEGVNNILWGNEGDLVVTGDGKIDIVGKEYLFGGNANVTVDGPTLNISGNGWSQVHIGARSGNGVLTFKGDSVINIVNGSSGPGIDVAGICSSLVITDNVKLTIDTSGTVIQVRTALAPTDALPTSGASVEISGKAQVDIKKGNQALQLIADASLTATTGFTPTVVIKDEANFKAVTSGQGIVVKGNDKGGEKAVLQILDKATIDIDCSASNGQYAQCIDIRSGSKGSDVDITTTGTVKLKSNASGWNGAMKFSGATASATVPGHDVLIKDAKITIENLGSAYSQVNCGIYVNNKADSFVVAGDAEIDIKTTRALYDTASDKTNRSHGLYIAAGTVMTVKDNAKITVATDGTATNSWLVGAGAIYNNASTLNVQDNAVITATAGGGAIGAYVAQAGTLNVSGNAKMNLESTSASAIIAAVATNNNLTVSDNGFITLKGKDTAITLVKEANKADAALSIIGVKNGEISDKELTLGVFVKEGVAPSVTLTVGENEIVLDGKNPTALNGAAAYSLATGVLTLEDAEGIKKISWTEGDLIIEVKGENTIADAEGTKLLWVPAAATLTIEGEGTLNLEGKEMLLGSEAGTVVINDATVNVTATAPNANTTGRPSTAAVYGAYLTVSGKANLNITSAGAAVVLYGTADLALNIVDAANVTIDAGSTGILVDANKATGAVTNITTTGLVKIDATLSSWNNAGLQFSGNNHNVTMKDARVEITIEQSDLSEVCVGLYFQGKGDIVMEDIVLISTVNVNSTVKTNRGQALYMQGSLVTKGDTMIFLTTQGTAAGVTWSPAASALMIHGATVTMEDNSVIVANGAANKCPALALQTGILVMNDDAQMFLTAADHNAINLWSNQAHGITVNDNAAIKLESRSGVMGGPGTLTAEFDRQNKDTSIRDIFFAKGGEAPADMTAPEIPAVGGGEGGEGGEEGGTTPPTSDAVISAIAMIASLAALATAAVVVLRKRFN